MKRLVVIGKNKKITATVYLVLRVLVIITMILQFLKGNYENVFMCLLTLILFAIPIIIDQKLNIKLPNTLEIIIFLFIFSAEILGEVQNFYFSENGNIVIVFDKYEVGAGSSGAPEFEINKEIYEKYMK